MAIDAWTIIFRLVMSAILSGIIGFEREFHGRAAGFRTHILLCVGSALIMLTSIHIFDVYKSVASVDPGRIAAGVITGIGFLGAGTIMHSKSSIRGLTTAASLWVVAGIGLAVGSGLYFGSFLTTVITLVALMIFSRLEQIMIRKDWYKTLVIDTGHSIEQLKMIREVISEHNAEITDFGIDRSRDGSNISLKIGLKLRTARAFNQIIEDVGRLSGVNYVKWED